MDSLALESSPLGLGRVTAPWWKRRCVEMSDEVAVRGHFSGFAGFPLWKCSCDAGSGRVEKFAAADGRISATTMPSSPPGAVGRPGCSRRGYDYRRARAVPSPRQFVAGGCLEGESGHKARHASRAAWCQEPSLRSTSSRTSRPSAPRGDQATYSRIAGST